MDALVVPTEIVFEQHIPWPNGEGVLFEDDKSKAGLGKGELSLAAMLLGINVNVVSDLDILKKFLTQVVGGQSSTHDVHITSEYKCFNIPDSHFCKFEVKEAKGDIRLAEDGMREVSLGFGFFRRLANDVKNAIESMDEMLELTLPSSTHTALREFASKDCQDINAGHLSRGRAFGNTFKNSKQKFGLYQAIKILSQLKRARLRARPKGWKIRVYEPDLVGFKKTGLWLDMTQNNAVGTLKMNLKDDGSVIMERKVKQALVKHLGYNEFEADLAYHLDNPTFDDPEVIFHKFSDLAVPSKAFAKVDFLALVTNKGVEIIPRDRLDARLTLTKIGSGRPSYSVNELGA